MKIALIGDGKMGHAVKELAHDMGHEIIATFSRKMQLPEQFTPPDAFIDFSNAACVMQNLEKSAKYGVPHVIGTTGWEEQLPAAKVLVEKAGSAALYAPNFSIGVLLFIRLAKEAAQLFDEYDVGGIEIHHAAKKDSPSGTAKAIERVFPNKLHFSSVRVGSCPGTHTVLLDSKEDTVTLTHEAKSRAGFAKGALKAAEWLHNKKGWYTLDDYIGSIHSARHTL